MALVSPIPAIPQRIDQVRFCDVRVPEIMASSGGIVEEPVTQVIEDKLYVAVGKEVKESKSILLWALQHSGGKKICIIHVHQPAQMIPIMGGKFPASKLKPQEVKAYQEIERQNMHKMLDDFLRICSRVGARAEKVLIEMDCIEKGIVELISQEEIRHLVIGAAAEKHYSRRMNELKSKKAVYVRVQAPVFCHIQFICKGHLIYTREGNLDGVNIDVVTHSLQAEEIMEELQIALDQKSLLESQIATSDRMVKELEEKILSDVDLLQNYKKERDELQIERDNAVKVAEELREQQAEASSTHTSQFFSEFFFSEIEEATRNFDPSLKIGEGGYGSIYKGILRHTEVAIKILHPHSMQGPSEFQQEVDVLSKLRHPNLVTLIGACPEAWTLIYEYLPNGSLEDRLNCKDNTPPLSWQARIRIATELCSVLIFLHSSDPHIIHSDLKPANVLLDANLVSKLSDFGICRVISRDENSGGNTTLCHRTDLKGTFGYMDPELLQTGELTPKSDVYSFGMILLGLLTGSL